MKYRVDEKVLFRKIDGEGVLLDAERGIYFALNTTGTLVWCSLVDGLSEDEILDKIVSNYDVESRAAQEDLLRLLEELSRNKLITRLEIPL